MPLVQSTTAGAASETKHNNNNTNGGMVDSMKVLKDGGGDGDSLIGAPTRFKEHPQQNRSSNSKAAPPAAATTSTITKLQHLLERPQSNPSNNNKKHRNNNAALYTPFSIRPRTRNTSDNDDSEDDDDDVQSIQNDDDDDNDNDFLDEESLGFSQIHEATHDETTALHAIVEESDITTEGPVSEASWRHRSSNNNNNNASFLSKSNYSSNSNNNNGSSMALRMATLAPSSILENDEGNHSSVCSEQWPLDDPHLPGGATGTRDHTGLPASSPSTDRSSSTLATADGALASEDGDSFSSPKLSLKSFRDLYNNSESLSSQSRRHSVDATAVAAGIAAAAAVQQPLMVHTSSLKDFRDLYHADDATDNTELADLDSESGTESTMSQQPAAVESVDAKGEKSTTAKPLEATSMLGDFNTSAQESMNLLQDSEMNGNGPTPGSSLLLETPSAPLSPPENSGGSTLQSARLRNESMRNSLNSALRVYEQLYGQDAAKSVFQRLTTNPESPSKGSPEQKQREEAFEWKRTDKLDTASQSTVLDVDVASSISALATDVSSDKGIHQDSESPGVSNPETAIVKDAPTESRDTTVESTKGRSASMPRYLKYRTSLSPQSTSPTKEVLNASRVDDQEMQVANKSTSSSPHVREAQVLANDAAVNVLTSEALDRDEMDCQENGFHAEPLMTKSDDTTPLKSNKSAMGHNFIRFRESLARGSSRIDKSLSTERSSTVTTSPQRSSDVSENVESNSSKIGEMSSSSVSANSINPTGPRYQSYRESLRLNSSRSVSVSPPQKNRIKRELESNRIPKEAESVASGFSESFHLRTNTSEFLDVWNAVVTDRTELEAERSATKKLDKYNAAKARQEASSFQNTDDLEGLSRDLPDIRLPPIRKDRPSEADSIDIESGYLSAKADSSDYGTGEPNASRDWSRLRCYAIIAFFMIFLPLAIGLGTVYARPNNKDLSESANGEGNSTSRPLASTSPAPSTLMYPTRSNQPIFDVSLSPVSSQPSPDAANTPIFSPQQPVVPNFTPEPTPLLTKMPQQTSPAPSYTPSSSAPTKRPFSPRPSALLITSQPAAIDPTIAAQLFRLLVPESFDNGASILSEGSPQSLAFQWLASNPTLFTTYADQQIIQRYALATFYFSTDGKNWLNGKGWLSDASECTWTTRAIDVPLCDGNDLVVNLDVGQNDLAGIVPTEIALLTGLEFLNIRGGPNTSIGGILPGQIGLLTRLKVFEAQENSFFGQLPFGFRTLRRLEILDLSMNQLSGAISSGLSQMNSLKVLNLTLNELTGTLPTNLNSLTSLEQLLFGNNSLSGTVRIGTSLTELKNLHLERNSFTSIGSEVRFMTQLEVFLVNDNNLTGRLQPAIGSLGNLEKLQLSNNELTGSIPTEFGRLVNLTDLSLAANALTGQIPTEIELLSNLISLQLQSNDLTGPLPDELSNMDQLKVIQIQNNNISGNVSDPICDAFSDFFPVFYLDCRERSDGTTELSCPPGSCCTFCCNDEEGCQCVHEGTIYEFLCSL